MNTGTRTRTRTRTRADTDRGIDRSIVLAHEMPTQDERQPLLAPGRATPLPRMQLLVLCMMRMTEREPPLPPARAI